MAVVMLDSVLYLRLQFGTVFFYAEWFFTILFTIEYLLRLFSAPNRVRYVFSFFGVVDLLSVLPSYLSLIFGGVQYLIVVRILRILRVFRVLKLKSYMQQAGFLPQPYAPVNKNHRVLLVLGAVGYDFRLGHLCGRGARKWLYQYSGIYLLGDGNFDHGGLWRYVT
nr:ion transporter [Psychrobacter sp. PraFG1]UTT87731.1 ion transporter [Psychrobacter sp. PraFG1]